MVNKKFVLIMYMLIVLFLIGLIRTAIFNLYIYGLGKEPPQFKFLFIGDEQLIGAIGDRFENADLDNGQNDDIKKIEDSSVKWDYFFQQGSFFNKFISSVISYNEAELNLPRVSLANSSNNNEASNVYDLGEGYIVNIIEKRDNNALVEKISGLNDFLHERGIDYMFFLAPGKISRSEESEIPFFIDNHSNENADELLKQLKDNNICVYDLRDDFEKDNNYRSFFYQNDHHWNNKGSLLAAEISAREICKNAGLEYDKQLFDIENYALYSFNDRFYGSMITDTAFFVSKNQKSDYVLYLPTFKTDFSTANIRGDYENFGTMEELFCNWNELNNLNKEDEMIYKSFGIGDTGKVRNNTATNDYKILVLADSYAYSYVPYLALQFKQVLRINLRSYQESIYDYIDKEKPDMVIQINDQDNNIYAPDNPEELWEFE